MNLLSPRGVADPQCAGFLGRLRRRISRTKSSSEKQTNAKCNGGGSMDRTRQSFLQGALLSAGVLAEVPQARKTERTR